MFESFFKQDAGETLEDKVKRVAEADWRGYETIEQLRGDLDTPGLMIAEPIATGRDGARRGTFMSGSEIAGIIDDMLGRSAIDRVEEIPDSSRGGLRSVVRALLETHFTH